MIWNSLRKMVLVAILLWVSMFSLTACHNETSKPVKLPETVIAAKHLKLTLQAIPSYYTTSGTVTSDHRVSISTRLPGYIRDIAVREGDAVKAGQVLLYIDAGHAKQAVVQATADLSNAKAEMFRYVSLLKEGAATSQQADKVKLRYEVAQSQLKQAKHQLSYAKILSPVNGVVVEKRMSQGDLASVGMPILTLEDPSSLLVQTYVSEQFIGEIRDGDSVNIEIASLKRSFNGVVRQVVQAADPVSHQFLVKISLPAMEGIHPGMYAQAQFKTAVRQALLIPKEAVFSQAGMHAVYVLNGSNIAHYRLIRAGKVVQGMMQVLAGLNDGDEIVWDSIPALKTGVKVQL